MKPKRYIVVMEDGSEYSVSAWGKVIARRIAVKWAESKGKSTVIKYVREFERVYETVKYGQCGTCKLRRLK